MNEQNVVEGFTMVRRSIFLPPNFPEIVALCGSSRFRQQHEEAQKRLTLEGKIVIPMGLYGHLEGMDMDGSIKKMLDVLHFRKIDISDSIFVVNHVRRRCRNCRKWIADVWCNCSPLIMEDVPYIGESTRNEINYATTNGKKIMYLNTPE